MRLPDEPLPEVDWNEFERICKAYDAHYKRQKTCRFWRKVPMTFTINGKQCMSHFNECHHIVNRTHNCGHMLCPIPTF